jgi:hypothetical protein
VTAVVGFASVTVQAGRLCKKLQVHSLGLHTPSAVSVQHQPLGKSMNSTAAAARMRAMQELLHDTREACPTKTRKPLACQNYDHSCADDCGILCIKDSNLAPHARAHKLSVTKLQVSCHVDTCTNKVQQESLAAKLVMVEHTRSTDHNSSTLQPLTGTPPVSICCTAANVPQRKEASSQEVKGPGTCAEHTHETGVAQALTLFATNTNAPLAHERAAQTGLQLGNLYLHPLLPTHHLCQLEPACSHLGKGAIPLAQCARLLMSTFPLMVPSLLLSSS